jgi:DNA-binding transcriptional ArsR family regulator
MPHLSYHYAKFVISLSEFINTVLQQKTRTYYRDITEDITMTKERPKKSWPIPVYSGLLQNGHKKKMGEAIWEFLWCIDKTTVEENGVGWVLGKKPVTIEEIAKDLEESWRSVQRHLETLKNHRYIIVIRVSKGIVIGVLKSKKWSGNKGNISSEEREILNFLKGISGYPFNYELDLEFLRTLWVDFPGIKILEELKKWKVWLFDNRKRIRAKINYRSRLRNWLKIAKEGKYGAGRPSSKEVTRKGWQESDKYRRLYRT